ncbi:MAG: fibronectin type III domain-containing protein [Beutenbergiaceae bacterium]
MSGLKLHRGIKPRSNRGIYAFAIAAMGVALAVSTLSMAPPATGDNDADAAAADTNPFTIVVIPDTQKYAENADLAANYTAQTEWIVEQQDALGIKFVMHLGDIVNSHPVTSQWDRATAAQSVLDEAAIPNSVLPGNHDMSLSTGEAPKYNTYFPPSRYADASWNSDTVSYGGYLGQNQFGPDPVDRQNMNNYSLLTVGGVDLLMLNIEYEMPQYSIDWAQRVIDAYPDRTVIMATHGWITQTGDWMNWTLRTDTDTNTAVDVFNNFVYNNCSISMVVAGHMADKTTGEANRTDLNACGEPVQQILTDYQRRDNGGDGWLRYYTFNPAEATVDAYTYSPVLDQYENDENSQFSLPIALGPDTDKPVTLVAADAQWRWLGTPTEWPDGWLADDFDDSAWATGQAPLGFGHSTIATSIDPGPPNSLRPLSTIFRHTFTVEDPALLSDLRLTTRADDGIAIYINGTEVNRTNLPTGTLRPGTYATLAPSTNRALNNPITIPIDPNLLQPGRNVITASTHLNYRNTYSTSFSAQLSGLHAGGPAPTVTAPAVTASVSGTTTVDLSWTSDEPNLTGFDITRDGVALTSLPADARSYSDSGLSAATSYAYTVTAIAGDEKSAPATITVTTPESGQTSPVTLVASAATWRWLGTPTSWPDGWQSGDFDDSDWGAGQAPLGFGHVSIVTNTDPGPPNSSRPLSTLYRHTFTLDDPALLSDLTLTSRADDGVVIYINGTEVNRTNLPSGTLRPRTYATAAPSTTQSVTDPVSIPIDISLLQAGTNVISASTHLNYRNTYNTSFAAELSGLREGPPRELSAPELNATSTAPTTAELEWTTSEPGVTGFEITRDGATVRTVPAATRSYTDAGLTAETSYNYGVSAIASDRRSEPATATITTPASGQTVPVTLVDSRASWRWLGTPNRWPSGWLNATFNDSRWGTGQAPLGFGHSSIVTNTDAGPPNSLRPRSTLFRHTFTVDDPSALSALTLISRADDGVVIYINGVEVNRTNLPSGPLNPASYATRAPTTNRAIAIPIVVPIPANLLQPGVNVITASTHLNYRNTYSSSFAAELSGLMIQ